MSKYTKQALGESLKNLLLKKPLKKITVTEIVEDCGVNRMTFYYHFHDIYDLLEWICVRDAEKELEEQRSSPNWEEGLMGIFEKIRENKAFVTNIYQSISRDYVERYIYRTTEALFISVVEEFDHDNILSDEDKAFIASYYRYAFLGITLNWIEDDMQEDPKDIIEKLSILVKGDLATAIVRITNR
ncbi:MAG: TetR family transcriptional regulator C-terminal domain-containing protein [Firmicutes bacterium]|nr:TetR family transcriptional regulator C-terminal domain-containing protein [Bacillota bacterium]